MEHSSAKVRSGLKDLLKREKAVLAAWEGGSAATGFLDEYSDLDLLIVISDEDTEPIFKLLDGYLEDNYGIQKKFRLPEPTWHGMSQCFYLLRDFPNHFYCDICVVPASNPHKLTEPDRHGHAVVWFDKAGIYKPVVTPAEERNKLVGRVFASATAFDWLRVLELKKALARGKWISSQFNYMVFINRNLVPLLNIKYRPAKADFGINYVDREYPPEISAEISELLKVCSVEEIREKSARAINWFNELKEELAPLIN